MDYEIRYILENTGRYACNLGRYHVLVNGKPMDIPWDETLEYDHNVTFKKSYMTELGEQ